MWQKAKHSSPSCFVGRYWQLPDVDVVQGCLSPEVTSELKRFEAIVSELLSEGADLESRSEGVSLHLLAQHCILLRACISE